MGRDLGHSARNGRISLAPSAQLMPTDSGRACITEVQNASTVCPDRVRPLLSVMVTEIVTRAARAQLLLHARDGDQGGLGVWVWKECVSTSGVLNTGLIGARTPCSA